MDIDTVTDLLPAPGVAWEPGDAFLAGGTWLFSQEQPGVRRLLDLQAFGWQPLTLTPAGDLEIAATCTLAALARYDAPVGWAAWPVVAPCMDALLGSFKVLDVATVGGNLCLALPAAPMTTLATGLDATCTIWTASGRGRTLPAADLVVGDGATSLAPGELLRSVRLPSAALRSRCVFRRISLTPHGRSASAVLARRAADGAVTVAVTAALPRPAVLRFAAPPEPAAALAALDEQLAALALPWLDDVHGLAPWRSAMTRRLLVQALDELADLEDPA